jgi:hypothetical protein
MGLGNISRGAFKFVYGSVKGFDSFSNQIVFSYKGEHKFKTFIGGIMSMAILAVMTIYTYSLAQVLWYRKDTNKSRSTSVVNLISSTETHFPGKSIH